MLAAIAAIAAISAMSAEAALAPISAIEAIAAISAMAGIAYILAIAAIAALAAITAIAAIAAIAPVAAIAAIASIAAIAVIAPVAAIAAIATIAATAAIKLLSIATRDFGKEQEEQIILREELTELTLASNDANTTDLEIIQQLGFIHSLNNKELRDEIEAIKDKTKAQEEYREMIEKILALESNTLSKTELEKLS